ncbi:MAG: Unknown protein [uncultured Sulfurovum sp.]|uniref:Uncharacterized protein n=1 Tax=uncultured Sulfurovum sp. TaxID=269237 RepID=A0A6S6U4B4_9BACT|nr:MAG: Unknown protein [uncultured Sulfurovum sp.]
MFKKIGLPTFRTTKSRVKKETSLVFGGLWAVELVEDKIFIAPYRKTSMNKAFKEWCRIKKILLK